MASHPDSETERPPWSETPWREIQMQIGQALRQHYELPQELPSQLLALLMQIDGKQE
jgi:hypothetical protein